MNIQRLLICTALLATSCTEVALGPAQISVGILSSGGAPPSGSPPTFVAGQYGYLYNGTIAPCSTFTVTAGNTLVDAGFTEGGSSATYSAPTPGTWTGDPANPYVFSTGFFGADYLYPSASGGSTSITNTPGGTPGLGNCLVVQYTPGTGNQEWLVAGSTGATGTTITTSTFSSTHPNERYVFVIDSYNGMTVTAASCASGALTMTVEANNLGNTASTAYITALDVLATSTESSITCSATISSGSLSFYYVVGLW